MRLGSIAAVCLGTALALPARAADRVGSDTCKGCHVASFEAWRASAHAKAAESLTPAQREDPRCAHCHSPEVARNLEEAAVLGTDALGTRADPGVTCEACHGAGQYYSPNYVMRDGELARAVGLIDPGQKSCLVCHTPDAPSLTPFDFASKVKLIDHWSQSGTKKPEKHPARSTNEAPPPSPMKEAGVGLAQVRP